MIKTIKLYIKMLQNPVETWGKLCENKRQNQFSFTHVYGIMLLIMPFSVVGKLMDIAEFNWNILISDALLTFVSLFASLHIAASLVKLFYESTEKRMIPFSEVICYTAHASAAVYASVWFVELTQMPIFWFGALYGARMVWESIQTGYLEIDETRKHRATWVISLILGATPFLVEQCFGMMIKIG
jgi:hypothetical protein